MTEPMNSAEISLASPVREMGALEKANQRRSEVGKILAYLRNLVESSKISQSCKSDLLDQIGSDLKDYSLALLPEDQLVARIMTAIKRDINDKQIEEAEENISTIVALDEYVAQTKYLKLSDAAKERIKIRSQRITAANFDAYVGTFVEDTIPESLRKIHKAGIKDSFQVKIMQDSLKIINETKPAIRLQVNEEVEKDLILAQKLLQQHSKDDFGKVLQEICVLKIPSMKTHALLDGINNGSVEYKDVFRIWEHIKVSDHEGYAQNKDLRKAAERLFSYVSPDMVKQFAAMDSRTDIDPIIMRINETGNIALYHEILKESEMLFNGERAWKSFSLERQREIIAYMSRSIMSADEQHICIATQCYEKTILENLKHKYKEAAELEKFSSDIITGLTLINISKDTKELVSYELTGNMDKDLVSVISKMARNHIKLLDYDADHNGHIGMEELVTAMKAAQVVASAPASSDKHLPLVPDATPSAKPQAAVSAIKVH